MATSGECVLHGALGVVQRSEIDSMPCGDGLHFLDARGGDEASSLREGFEAALESQSHAFQETSVDHIGEGMAIQNSTKIRREAHAAGDLAETSEEDGCAGHLRAGREILRVARIANESVGRD